MRLPDGRTAHATGAPVSLPSNVAGDVAAVLGLDDTVAPHRIGRPRPLRRGLANPDARGPSDAAPRAQTTAPRPRPRPSPAPDAAAAATHDNGLTDTQLADAYGAGELYQQGDDGSGQRIAVYELEPFLRADLAHFDACYFGAAQAASMLRRLHVHEVGGGQPYGTGEGEANLDVEDLVRARARGRIDVYVAPQADALGQYAAIIDSDSRPDRHHELGRVRAGGSGR